MDAKILTAKLIAAIRTDVPLLLATIERLLPFVRHAAEARDLMGDPQDWYLPVPPAPDRIDPWDPVTAKLKFLERFRKLVAQ